ncbi:hypothetical protein WMY93_024877 [Mugilogobius chulae]|uniref:Uncharacterized protein n=1 Tax=Mugilogobius chulae TaxID=88201 RepID=A0AAW0NBW1_9GOBI
MSKENVPNQFHSNSSSRHLLHDTESCCCAYAYCQLSGIPVVLMECVWSYTFTLDQSETRPTSRAVSLRARTRCGHGVDTSRHGVDSCGQTGGCTDLHRRFKRPQDARLRETQTRGFQTHYGPGNSLDFKALRAKFQEEEALLKQSFKPKPALPEKPKVVPPPQSPPHYLPSGARPSLLASINQSLEGNTAVAPRVVFKDEKKESKKPLLQSNSKPKESKIKLGKDKSKGGRERLYDEDDPPQQKPKKESKEKKKETTADLVPATPPPKNSNQEEGPSWLQEDSVDARDPALPTSTISTSPHFNLPPALVPEVPASPVALSLESENTAPTETLYVLRPPSQTEVAPSMCPSLILPEPDVVSAHSSPSPEPEPTVGQINRNSVEIPPPPVDVDSALASPKLERPLSALSALSALERAEEMNPGKRTPPGDMRIFNALEKARKMTHGHQKPSSPLLVAPSPEELPEVHDEPALFVLPPIDYEDKMGKGLPLQTEVNGVDHRSSLVVDDVSEVDITDIPELPETTYVEIEPHTQPIPKPTRPTSVDLSAFRSPPPVGNSVASLFLLSSQRQAHTDVPELNNVSPEVHSPVLPVSNWANRDYNGSDSPDGPHLPNGTIPTAEVHATTPVSDVVDSPTNRNSFILTQENIYENVTSKKKGKSEVKKRKGPPKKPIKHT